MGRFAGFPDGAIAAVPIPRQFFAELLPEIETLAELKVTLHVLAATFGGARAPAWLDVESILGDELLRDGLSAEAGGGAAAVSEGLRRAVARGTLLEATIRYADGERTVVAPNSARGRRALAVLRTRARGTSAPAIPPVVASAAPSPERPRIFELYEASVGLVQPIIADELRAAADLYPATWVEEAFHEAVAYNRRNWRYVKRILERWATEGKDSDAAPRDRVAGSRGPAGKRQWSQTYTPGERLPDL